MEREGAREEGGQWVGEMDRERERAGGGRDRYSTAVEYLEREIGQGVGVFYLSYTDHILSYSTM
jgi:hypothetical protein